MIFHDLMVLKSSLNLNYTILEIRPSATLFNQIPAWIFQHKGFIILLRVEQVMQTESIFGRCTY